MLPNEQVYGAASTWLHVYPFTDYHEDNTSYIAAWQTIAGGINAGKVDYSKPLDNSICYCAIADDSPAAGIYTVACNDLTAVKETKPLKEDFYISQGDYSSGFVTQCYYDVTNNFPALWTYDTSASPNASNPNMALKPLTSVSLKDLVMCIYVVGYDNAFGDMKVSTYNGYKQQYSASHPNIVGIYGVPYCRVSNSSTRFALTNSETNNFCGFARMGKFTIPNNTAEIIDYSGSISHTGGLIFHMWGIPHVNGGDYYGDTPNYVYRAYGQGGTFTAKQSRLFYIRQWGAAYQQHAGDDWIRRVAASYGVFFVDRTSYATSAAYASANMCLGTIDEDGLCHGDYTSGDANRDQPQYSWTSTNESTYNPDTPIDPNHYSNATAFNTIGNLASMHKRYVLNATGVGALMTDLWTISNDFITNPSEDVTYEDKVIDNFLTNNPIDCIVSLERYPLNPIPRGDTLLRNIKYGRISGQAAGYVMPYTSMQYDFQTIEIWPRFGNCFLDYSPYTRLELYIPFCGTTELDPSDFIYRNLSVKMFIDFTTGTCTAYILSNSMVVKSVNGECSIKIPVSGIDTTTMQSQIQNAIIQERKAYGQAAGLQYTDMAHLGSKYTPLSFLWDPKNAGMGGKNLSDSIYGKKSAAKIWDFAGAQYNLEHQIAPIHQIGSATAATGWAIDLQCRLLIYSPTGEAVAYKKGLPVLADLTQYAHLNGFAMLADDTLSKYHGFTKISSIDLTGISATETEQTQIMQLLTSGVYLP